MDYLTTKLKNPAVPLFTLNNGRKIPAIGYGTWQADDKDQLKKALNIALSVGYRHIDTAPVYFNEDVIGEVLDTWINKKKLIKREDLFITSKLPFNSMRARNVSEAINSSLKKMKLTYFDMYLIHAPFGFVEGKDAVPKDADGQILLDLSTDHVTLWKAMEYEVDKGTVKSIGLCNFNEKQIERIMSIATIPPANLQVELHLYLQQKELVAYCKKHKIQLTSFSSLAPQSASRNGGNDKNLPTLLEDPAVKRIASKYHKTPAQIALKYLVDEGIAIIPKSINEDRISLNIQITDFKLSSDDKKELQSLDRGEEGRVLKFHEHFPGVEKHPEYPHFGP